MTWFEDVNGRLYCPPPPAHLIRGDTKIYLVYNATDQGVEYFREAVLSNTPNHANWSQIRSQIAEGAHLIESPDYICERPVRTEDDLDNGLGFLSVKPEQEDDHD